MEHLLCANDHSTSNVLHSPSRQQKRTKLLLLAPQDLDSNPKQSDSLIISLGTLRTLSMRVLLVNNLCCACYTQDNDVLQIRFL